MIVSTITNSNPAWMFYFNKTSKTKPQDQSKDINMVTKTTAAKAGPKPKKSVALSGVVAGNTALRSVGLSGNDLHYRGYEILDLADNSEFEEVAHLLIHGKLPNKFELKA